MNPQQPQQSSRFVPLLILAFGSLLFWSAWLYLVDSSGPKKRIDGGEKKKAGDGAESKKKEVEESIAKSIQTALKPSPTTPHTPSANDSMMKGSIESKKHKTTVESSTTDTALLESAISILQDLIQREQQWVQQAQQQQRDSSSLSQVEKIVHAWKNRAAQITSGVRISLLFPPSSVASSSSSSSIIDESIPGSRPVVTDEETLLQQQKEELKNRLASLSPVDRDVGNPLDSIHGVEELSAQYFSQAKEEVEANLQREREKLLELIEEEGRSLIEEIKQRRQEEIEKMLAVQREQKEKQSRDRYEREEEAWWSEQEREVLQLNERVRQEMFEYGRRAEHRERERENEEERQQRISALYSLLQHVRQFQSYFDSLDSSQNRSSELHQLTLRLFSVQQLIRENSSSDERKEAIEKIKEMRGVDAIIDVAVDSLTAAVVTPTTTSPTFSSSSTDSDAAPPAAPTSIAEMSLKSARELHARWKRVERAMIEDYFMPDHDADENGNGQRSIWSYLVGRLFSFLYIPPPQPMPLLPSSTPLPPPSSSLSSSSSSFSSPIELSNGLFASDHDLPLLSHIDHAMNEGDYQSVLHYYSHLSPKLRAIGHQWRDEIESAARVEMVVDVMKSRVVELAVEMSP